MGKSTDLQPLLDLVARLRAPDGCPWDREQRLADLRAYLLEEAHEVAAAIDQEDWDALAEELGDLLFQVAFVLELGREAGELDAAEVIEGIHAKMVARHPHVFGDETQRLATAEEVRGAWESRKSRNRQEGTYLLDGIPPSLPALLAAYRMGQKAAGVGFDWPEAGPVLDKVREELDELEEALETGGPTDTERDDAVTEELGDLLFSVANLSRKLGRDPEGALAVTNAKFRRRFASIEQALARQGQTPDQVPPEELEKLWEAAKEAE